MAKKYQVKCPYCDHIRFMRFSDLLNSLTNTSGMRGGDGETRQQLSTESLNEENWIDLKKPCPACGCSFSFNYVTGESRE